MTQHSQTPTGVQELFAQLESDQPTPDGDASEDGRSRRRHLNREKVIRALIDLIREGDLKPTVDKIADRAELSHRSVFRYFDDLNDLARAAFETEFRDALPLAVVEDIGVGPLDDRIDRLVVAQLRTLQRTHLLGLVARSRAADIEAIEVGQRKIYGLRLEQITRHFAPELHAMPTPRAEAIASSIAVMTWLDSYDVQVRTARRSPNEIAELWKITLRALLT